MKVIKLKRKLLKLLFTCILIIGLTGCSSKENEIEKPNKTNIEEKINVDEKVLNSTVNIYTATNDFGAGFSYDNYIITNYHVVYGTDDITVVTYSKDEYKASIVGFDSESDIAVLKIDASIPSLETKDSDEVQIGEEVTAIGNPNGDLSFSKAKGRVLDANLELVKNIDKNKKYIWYDGNAITGYSGGPVYDNKGKVIGILNLKYVGDLSQYDFDNLCGIIPMNQAKTVINNIIKR